MFCGKEPIPKFLSSACLTIRPSIYVGRGASPETTKTENEGGGSYSNPMKKTTFNY